VAGPSVVVRVLGDLTGLSQSMDQKSEAVSKTVRHNFGTMFSTLNTTGALAPFQDVFYAINNGLDQLEEHGHKVSSALLGAGVVAAGIGGLLTQLGSAEQASRQQLQAAIANTGHSWADYQAQVEAAVKAQARFGNNAVETEDALRHLTQATGDPTKALNLLGLAADLAASKHEDLSTASTQLARVLNGNSRLLKEFGIIVPHVGNAVGDFATQADEVNYAISRLSATLKGDAAAASDTFMGHVKAVTTTVEDQVATWGQKYGPALTAAGSALTVLEGGYKTVIAIIGRYTKVTETATAATEALAGAEGTAGAAGAAGGAASGAGGLLAMGGRFGAWGALVAASAAAGYEIGIHWNMIWADIKSVAADAWHWLVQNWEQMVGTIVGSIVGLPAQFGYVFTEVGRAIVDAFRWAFNEVIDLWDRFHFTLPKVSFLGAHIGGQTIGVPRLPHLAQGGVITQTGLVYAHAGEAITPIDKTRGPAVHIEHAQFNEPVDVDLLMKKVEFALAAGAAV
jgi:hypothetical protein